MYRGLDDGCWDNSAELPESVDASQGRRTRAAAAAELDHRQGHPSYCVRGLHHTRSPVIISNDCQSGTCCVSGVAFVHILMFLYDIVFEYQDYGNLKTSR